MKLLACSAFFSLAFLATAHAQEPVPLARGNTPGEPHHHLKIENEYVRVYYVEAPPHEATLLHQHDHDYIYVSLGPSDVVSAVLNKPEIHLQLKDGETHFTRGGFAHVARNLADTPFRNITIELLKPQGEAQNDCAEVILGTLISICDPGLPRDFETNHQFESTEVTLDLARLGPKAKHAEITKLAYLIVNLKNPGIEITAKDKSSRFLQAGEIMWIDPSSNIQVSNLGSETAEFVQLTFKDAGQQQTVRHKPKT